MTTPLPRPGAPKRVEIIVRGVALRKARLLVCRDLEFGHAYLPGGHVEPGEPSAAALAREFEEETGLEVSTGGFILANENLFVQEGKARHELNLLFHVEHGAGPWPELIPSREPRIAFEWIEPAALPESGLLPEAVLAWLLAGGPDSRERTPWISHAALPR